MLEQLELEAQAKRTQSEIAAVDFDDRRLADMRSDEPLGRRNLFPIYGDVVIHAHFGSSRFAAA